MSAETAYRRFHEDLSRRFPAFVHDQRPEVAPFFSMYSVGEPCEVCRQALPLNGPHNLFWRFRQSERVSTTKQLRVEIPSDAIPARADVPSFFAKNRRAARADVFLKDGHWHVPRDWESGTRHELYDQLRPGFYEAVRLRDWAMHTMCDALLLVHT